MTRLLVAATDSAQTQNLHVDGSCYFVADKLAENDDLAPYLYYFIAALCTVRVITFLIDWRQLMKFKEAVPEPYLAADFNQQEFEDS